MTDKTYNGWTNHATWLVNLWWGDSFAEIDEARPQDLINFVEAILEHQDNTVETAFVMDMVRGYMDDVNWQELADAANEG